MIQDKRERCIAKITAVNAYKLEAELLGHISSLNINGFEDIYQFIRLNGFVLICIENNFIVASISSIRERDNTPTYTDKDTLNKIHSSKILELFPLGVLENNTFAFGVSNYPVLYSDVIYIKNKELDILFSKNDKDDKDEKQYLEIGSWTLMDNYNVKININEFFASHSAVLGNTGSGKSCTISAILQSIYKDKNYPKSQFIFFDINGEYKQAFEKLNTIKFKYTVLKEAKSDNKFSLPLHLLTIDEWELLLKASAKAQAPVLRNALGLYSLCKKDDTKNKIKTYIFCKIAKHLLESESSSTVSKIIANYQKLQNQKLLFCIKSHSFEEKKPKTQCLRFKPQENNSQNDFIYFGLHFGDIKNINEFQKRLSQLEQDNTPENADDTFFEYKNDCAIELKKLEEYIELAICWEEAHGNKQIRDYCSSLITRLKSLSQREEFKIFETSSLEEINSKENNIEKYITGLIEKNNITIINLETTDDEIIEIVSSVLARLFFEYTKNLKPRNSKPIHLVLDEAHRYISNNKGKEYSFEANRIFERIAKEARKYGLFLMLSSQRPSELNETVVSQCSNFIIHRIQNPNDLQYIRSMTPFVSKSILDQLPSIPQQEALIFGTAVHLPILFKVKNVDPLPDSKNNDIVTNWS